MERYNEENDFTHYYEMMSKKTTAELEKELAKLENQADKYRPREFVGFRMTPQASRKLDIIDTKRLNILNEVCDWIEAFGGLYIDYDEQGAEVNTAKMIRDLRKYIIFETR